MNEHRRTFGEEIKAELSNKGMTAKDLAEEIGMKPQNLTRIIRGECSVTLDKINEIAVGLGKQFGFK